VGSHLKGADIETRLDLVRPRPSEFEWNGCCEAHTRSRSRRARIILLTSSNDKDVVRAALSTGAQGYVLKIDASTELLPAVAAVLGGNVFVSSGMHRERPCEAEEWLVLSKLH
jgi:CheY-like chemotaxis protein